MYPGHGTNHERPYHFPITVISYAAPGDEQVRAPIEKEFSPDSDSTHMIIAGSESQSLAVALAAEAGRELAPVTYERFPDGEQKVQVGGVDGEVIVVAATGSDRAHVELLQLQDAAREAGATEVTTVLPYMGYARQDRSFQSGDPVSARAVARAISTGTDRVLTVNPHEEGVCDFFHVPAESLDAGGRLAAPLGDLGDPLFLAPDEGAVDLAASVRDAYGRGDTDSFEKTRHSGDSVAIEPREAPVEGRDVVLVDDIVATGSTMSEAIAHLHELGAASVRVTCVHPLLASNARLKLARAGVEALYGTDTIEHPVSTVSVAPVIAEAL
jgi:ribose-phosphate pyrophosphokinase